MPRTARRAPRRKPLNRRRRKAASNGLRVVRLKRSRFYKNSIQVVTGTDYSAAWDFYLDLLPDVADFKALFEQYRLDKIVYKIIPKATESTLLGGVSQGNEVMQQIHSALDYDDGVAFTSVQQACCYDSYKMTRGNAIHTRTFKPMTETTVGGASVAPKAAQFIDCDNGTIVHRGVKVYIPAPLTAGTTVWYDVLTTYHMSFRGIE